MQLPRFSINPLRAQSITDSLAVHRDLELVTSLILSSVGDKRRICLCPCLWNLLSLLRHLHGPAKLRDSAAPPDPSPVDRQDCTLRPSWGPWVRASITHLSPRPNPDGKTGSLQLLACTLSMWPSAGLWPVWIRLLSHGLWSGAQLLTACLWGSSCFPWGLPWSSRTCCLSSCGGRSRWAFCFEHCPTLLV